MSYYGYFERNRNKLPASLAMAGSGRGCVGSIYNSNTNKSVYPLKLTETVIRQIDYFIKNERTFKQSTTINFDQQADGVITFPTNTSSGARQFVFRAQNHTERHSELKAVVKSDNQFYNVGTIRGSLRVCATDESFNNAKVKFNSVKAQNEQNCTKVYKQNGVVQRRPGHSTGPQGGGLGSGAMKGAVGAGSGDSGGRLADKPLRERVIHLLAPGNMERMKLMGKLRGGMNSEDGRMVNAVITEVATKAGRNLYALTRTVWCEVQEDWPFFTDDERTKAIANKRKYMQLEEDENSRSPSADEYGGDGFGKGGVAGRGMKRAQTFIDPTAKKPKVPGARAMYQGVKPTSKATSIANGYHPNTNRGSNFSSQHSSSNSSSSTSLRPHNTMGGAPSMGSRVSSVADPVTSHMPSHNNNSLSSNNIGGHHSPGSSSHSSHLSNSNNVTNGSHNSNNKASKSNNSHNNGGSSLLSVPSSNNSHQRSSSKYRGTNNMGPTVTPPMSNGGSLTNGGAHQRVPGLEDNGASHSSYLRTSSPGSRSASVSPMAASPAQNTVYANGQPHSRNPSPLDQQMGGSGSSSGAGHRRISPPTAPNGQSAANGSSLQGSNYNPSLANGRRSSSKSPPEATTRTSHGSGRNNLVNGPGSAQQLSHKSNGLSGGVNNAPKSVSPHDNFSSNKSNHHQYNNNNGGHHGQDGHGGGSSSTDNSRLSPDYPQQKSSSRSQSNNSHRRESSTSPTEHVQTHSPPAPVTNGHASLESPTDGPSTSDTDTAPSTDTASSAMLKSNMSVPTELTSYPNITSFNQRRTYRISFDKLYAEYKQIFKEMQASSERFRSHCAKHNNHEEGTPEHAAALKRITKAYCDMYPNFQQLTLRYNLLNTVLSHLKMRVREYDELLDTDPALLAELQQAQQEMNSSVEDAEEAANGRGSDRTGSARDPESQSPSNSGGTSNTIGSSNRQDSCSSPPSTATTNGVTDASVNGSYQATTNGNFHQQRPQSSKSDRSHRRYNPYDHSSSSNNNDHHQQSNRRSHSRNGGNTNSNNNSNNGGHPNR